MKNIIIMLSIAAIITTGYMTGYSHGIDTTTEFCKLAARNMKSGAWVEAPKSHVTGAIQ